MEIISSILYTGIDPAGKQLSAVFAGLETVIEMINKNETNIRHILDLLTTAVKSVAPFAFDAG
jgi:ABC-type transporter Mla subunit MlaD